jgi:CBS domain containing-hemolysin-like protein
MRRKIKELMTEVSQLPIIDENSTLFEAILAIGIFRGQSPGLALRCPVALVSDGAHNITGYLDVRSMLKGLEPRYCEIAESAEREDLPPDWIKSELERYGLCGNALDELCKKASETIIKTLMVVPEDKRIADAESSINEAIYQMVVTGYDYLFVRNGKAMAGIISLSDIMSHICETVKACRI